MSEIKDTDQILEETRGNKTTAAAIKDAAEVASQRAMKIHNTTLAIRDALDEAERIQQTAQATLSQATEDVNGGKYVLNVSTVSMIMLPISEEA